MKRILFPSLLLIVLLALAACGSSPAAPTAVAEVAPTAVPTDPPPTEPPPTATPALTATPRPTATPAPTEVACDLERLVEAVDSVALLTSYRQEATAYGQFANQQARQRMLTLNGAVETTDGQVSAIDMRMVSYTDAGTSIHIIMVDDQMYYSQEEGQWQVATEFIAETLSAQIGQARTIDDALLEILEDKPCEPFSESMDGRMAEGFRFSEFDLVDLAALPSAAGDLSQLPADIQASGEYIIWLAEVDDLLLPVGTQLTLTFDVGDGDSVIEAITKLSDFNAPLDIVSPDGEIATFPIELPRPDDAVVFLDESTGLAFFTIEPPEVIKAFYIDALTADGWTVGENSKETTADGQNVELQRFSRGEERLEMAIAVTDDDTIVAFSLLETP